MLKLDKLKRLIKKRKRIGRGGSRGGTSGRGHKGQKARTGDHGVGYGFEGGQMPLARRIPKRGFSNKRFEKRVITINLKDLDRRFKEGDEVTIDKLIEQEIITIKSSLKGAKRPLVKLLGDGPLTKKLTVYVNAASQHAQKMVNQAGGIIHILEGELK